MTNPRHVTLTWDWREQPDLDQLAAAITDLSGGTVHLHQVQTETDQYAVVLSTADLSAEQAYDIYWKDWTGE